MAEATSAARKYVKIIKARRAPRAAAAAAGCRANQPPCPPHQLAQFIMTKAGGSGGGDISVRFQGPTLQNMVGVADCKFPIRLEGLALSHMPHCSVRGAPPPRGPPLRGWPVADASPPDVPCPPCPRSTSRSCSLASSIACTRPRRWSLFSCPARWSSQGPRCVRRRGTPRPAAAHGRVARLLRQSPDDIKAAMTAIYPILVNFKKPIRATA